MLLGASDVRVQYKNAIQDEDLVVDGETNGCVKSFCYMGDTLMDMVE